MLEQKASIKNYTNQKINKGKKMSRNRRRRRNEGNTVEVEVKKQKIPKFWKAIWVLIGLLIFLSVTSFTGFYAPDIYMLLIIGLVIIGINFYLVYLLIKERKNES